MQEAEWVPIPNKPEPEGFPIVSLLILVLPQSWVAFTHAVLVKSMRFPSLVITVGLIHAAWSLALEVSGSTMRYRSLKRKCVVGSTFPSPLRYGLAGVLGFF